MKELKLHLGCFHKKIHGFINVDARKDINPDVVDDASILKKFKDNSASLIYASHVAEHFTREQSINAFKRWYEVLKSGGKLRIAVPDIQACCEHYICYKDLRILQAFLYGSQKHPYDLHYTGWDEKTLREDLESIGFKNVKRYDWRETEHFFIDDYSQCYLPNISYKSRRLSDKIEGKLMSLNLEATK